MAKFKPQTTEPPKIEGDTDHVTQVAGADLDAHSMRALLDAANAQSHQLMADCEQLREHLVTNNDENIRVIKAKDDRIGQLEAEIERLRGQLTELANERERLTKAAATIPPLGAHIGSPPAIVPIPNATGPVVISPLARRARVTIPNTHVGAIEVTIPRDSKNPVTAAIEAAKVARGIVAFGAGPEVEFLD